MSNGPRIQVALLMLASGLLAGCRSSPLSPSLPPPAGVLELTTNRPDGTTLVVNPCVDPENEPWPCTRDLQMTFSVVLNRDVDNAVVFTSFYNATGQLCAGGSTETVALTAGTPATMTASSVYTSLQGSSTPPECGLPVQTTRIVAHLIHDGGAAGHLLNGEFSKAYTFTNR